MIIDPQRRHNLLTGRTYYSLGVMGVKSAIATTLIGANAILANVFGRQVVAPFGKVWFAISFAALFVIAACTVTILFVGRARDRAEQAEGYTTALGGNQSYDLVDPEHGVVIREAGAPMLSRKQFVEARATVRRLLEERQPS